ncbi:MAG: uracil-DNA glycosylase [Chloroflexi bacterium]|nr:uracil-DNA glycosylase [Chloroflexota bacterium]
MNQEEQQAALATIAHEVHACTACSLHRGRTQAVPGDGHPNADIMFVGEAPGFYEDKQGLPFVGASGRYLDELLKMIGLTRQQVFITNIVRCRPPQNRDPLRPEIEACTGYLERQLDVIQPKLVATLGRYSMERFFPGEKISKIHGKSKRIGGRIYYPLFHPAAVLRNPSLKPVMEQDFRKMKQLVDEFDANIPDDTPPEDDPPPKPEQLSLF